MIGPQGVIIRCRCGQDYPVLNKLEFVDHAKICSPISDTPAPAEEQPGTEGLYVRICTHCNEEFGSDTLSNAKTLRDLHKLREHTKAITVTYQIQGRCLDYSLLLNLTLACFNIMHDNSGLHVISPLINNTHWVCLCGHQSTKLNVSGFRRHAKLCNRF
jgi:hypothetical protein